MKKFAAGIIALAVLITGAWLVIIPEGRINEMIEAHAGFADGEIYIRAEGVRKGLFYNISAERIFIKRKTASGDKTLVLLKDLRAALSLASLIRLAPAAEFTSAMGGGVVTGVIHLTGGRGVSLNGRGISLKGLPALTAAGLNGEGELSFDISFGNNEGDIRFSVERAHLAFTSGAGVFLPFDVFKTIRGSALIMGNGEKAVVRSLSLEGPGIYARLKGSIARGKPDMQLELMTERSFKDTAVLMLLEQYKVSPGYYAVPVKTAFF
ncbi:MAG: type II secretion system protein GspN [Deltaproteobacteria bacterium]|nr:type II secretion system protein GspN [Deltaproteobacteria bacterium]